MLRDEIEGVSELFRCFPYVESIEIKKDSIIRIKSKGVERIFTSKESVELLEWLESQ